MNTRKAASVIARQMTTVRQERVLRIKLKLKAGQYNISSTRVAQALLLVN